MVQVTIFLLILAINSGTASVFEVEDEPFCNYLFLGQNIQQNLNPELLELLQSDNAQSISLSNVPEGAVFYNELVIVSISNYKLI